VNAGEVRSANVRPDSRPIAGVGHAVMSGGIRGGGLVRGGIRTLTLTLTLIGGGLVRGGIRSRPHSAVTRFSNRAPTTTTVQFSQGTQATAALRRGGDTGGKAGPGGSGGLSRPASAISRSKGGVGNNKQGPTITVEVGSRRGHRPQSALARLPSSQEPTTTEPTTTEPTTTEEEAGGGLKGERDSMSVGDRREGSEVEFHSEMARKRGKDVRKMARELLSAADRHHRNGELTLVEMESLTLTLTLTLI